MKRSTRWRIDTSVAEALASDPSVPPIVDVDWLSANYSVVIVCDARYYLDGRDNWAAYLDGHLPGARFVDMDTVLSSAPGPIVGRHPMPTPERFAAGLAELGIGNDAAVVAYDDLGGGIAGRLVWMLRQLGQPAALLSGGISAWKGTIERGAVDVDPVDREVLGWPPGAFVDADDVQNHIDAGGVVADSRSPERYRGETEPIDPRAGHIPGAINLPFVENLSTAGGTFRPVHELVDRFAGAGVDGESIVYCGSGVSACNNLLAMEAAGLGRARLYVGSWSGWSSDPARPADP